MTITRKFQEGVVFQSNLGIMQAIADPTPSVYTQTYSSTTKTLANPTYAAYVNTAPSGTTGATAGAFDTAANRDKVITDLAGLNTALAALAADVLVQTKLIAQITTDLANAGIIQIA